MAARLPEQNSSHALTLYRIADRRTGHHANIAATGRIRRNGNSTADVDEHIWTYSYDATRC